MEKFDISIIIPAKAEPDDLLGRTIDNLKLWVDPSDLAVQVIICTADGYGRAILDGISCATGEYFTIMTADGSDSPEDLLKMWAARKGVYAAVFGQRTKWEGYPKLKYFFNQLGNKMAAWFSGETYSDWTNPFKLYHREAVMPQVQKCKSTGMSFGMELALRVGMEHPFNTVEISWRDGRNGRGRSKFSLKQALGYLRTLLDIFF